MFAFAKNPEATEVSYRIECSSTLLPGSWTTEGVNIITDSATEIQARFLQDSIEKEFFRLVVSIGDDPGGPDEPASPVKLDVSSAEASVEQEGNEAPGAIDGDLSTRWSGEGVPETLTLDMGEAVSIAELHIAFFRGTERTTSFRVETSLDNATFEEVLGLSTSDGVSEGLQTFPVDEVTAARWVRIVSFGNSDNDWNSLNEVEVWGNSLSN